MNTIHDNQTRQELFRTQHNDNHLAPQVSPVVPAVDLPTTTTDYGGSDIVLYELGDGAMEAFPNFCLVRISKPKNHKGQICIIYNTGNIIIKGRNLEELVKRLISKKIAIIRITRTSDDPASGNPCDGNPTSGDTYCIDEIIFEEK